MTSKHLPVAILSVTALLTSCAPDYNPVVICHNANCVEPADPAEDDTVDALRDSLELTRDGRPVIDGIEVDTFWYGEEERCIFAHDLESDTDVEALRAAELINEALRARSEAGEALTRSADAFSVFVELKGHVGAETDLHTPAQRDAHAACALALASSVLDAADEGGYRVDVIFTSFEPALLTAVTEAMDYEDVLDRGNLRLGALQGIPAPLDGQSRPLDAFGPEVDLVDVHPQWVTETELHAYASRGWELAYWMFSITPETLDAIERDRPRWITTSEANALTRWLDR